MALRASCHGLFGLLARRRASPRSRELSHPARARHRTPPIVLGGSFAPSLELQWSRSALQFAETIIEREIEAAGHALSREAQLRAAIKLLGGGLFD
jgi:hypothetical protein